MTRRPQISERAPRRSRRRCCVVRCDEEVWRQWEGGASFRRTTVPVGCQTPSHPPTLGEDRHTMIQSPGFLQNVLNHFSVNTRIKYVGIRSLGIQTSTPVTLKPIFYLGSVGDDRHTWSGSDGLRTLSCLELKKRVLRRIGVRLCKDTPEGGSSSVYVELHTLKEKPATSRRGHLYTSLTSTLGLFRRFRHLVVVPLL